MNRSILNLENNYLLHLLFLLLIPFAFVLVKRRHISTCRSKLPPGPYPWQLIVNMFNTSPIASLSYLSQTYGPLYALTMGQLVIVVVSSPEIATTILKTHDHIYSGRYIPSLYYRILQVDHSTILGSKECNESWKYLRGICHKWIFSIKALKSRNEVREKKMMEMVNYLRMKEGKIVKLRDIVLSTLVNSLSNMLVSRDLVDIECEEGNQEVTELLKALIETFKTPSFVDLFPSLNGLALWENRKAMKIHQKIKSFWRKVIEDRRVTFNVRGEQSQDLLGALIDNGFCDDKICILLTEILGAGIETSCTTIEWLMAELIKNRSVMQKVRDEIANPVNGDITSASQHNMPYLEACLKETLRLHPPGSFIVPHRALETSTLKDYVIPKGSVILINIRALGRDPTIWNEPLRFKPERFLESKFNFKGDCFGFIPFGGGRRMCPGINVAINHTQCIMAFLVHYFDWLLPDDLSADDLNMTEDFGMTVYMKEPLSLIPRSRTSDTK